MGLSSRSFISLLGHSLISQEVPEGYSTRSIRALQLKQRPRKHGNPQHHSRPAGAQGPCPPHTRQHEELIPQPDVQMQNLKILHTFQFSRVYSLRCSG